MEKAQNEDRDCSLDLNQRQSGLETKYLYSVK